MSRFNISMTQNNFHVFISHLERLGWFWMCPQLNTRRQPTEQWNTNDFQQMKKKNVNYNFLHVFRGRRGAIEREREKESEWKWKKVWQVNFPLNQELRIAFKEQIGPNIRFYVVCILFSADGVFILNDEHRDCVTYNYRPFVSVFIHDCNWNERRIQFPSLKICHILWSVVNARGDSMIFETKIQYKDVGVVARFLQYRFRHYFRVSLNFVITITC